MQFYYSYNLINLLTYLGDRWYNDSSEELRVRKGIEEIKLRNETYSENPVSAHHWSHFGKIAYG